MIILPTSLFWTIYWISKIMGFCVGGLIAIPFRKHLSSSGMIITFLLASVLADFAIIFLLYTFWQLILKMILVFVIIGVIAVVLAIRQFLHSPKKAVL